MKTTEKTAVIANNSNDNHSNTAQMPEKLSNDVEFFAGLLYLYRVHLSKRSIPKNFLTSGEIGKKMYADLVKTDAAQCFFEPESAIYSDWVKFKISMSSANNPDMELEFEIVD